MLQRRLLVSGQIPRPRTHEVQLPLAQEEERQPLQVRTHLRAGGLTIIQPVPPVVSSTTPPVAGPVSQSAATT